MQNLYLVKNRWKYRKGIPAALRPFVDGQITEFVRWIGQHDGSDSNPPTHVVKKYADVHSECAALFAMAQKRASGHFDSLNAETIAHVIASARHELLAEDDEARFDEDTEDSERHWARRQENLASSLAAYKREYALGQVDDFTRGEAEDRCAALGLRVDTTSGEFRKLAKAYLGVLIESTEKALKRQDGEPVKTPEPPVPIAAHVVRKPSAQTITGLATDWWKENEKAGRAASTNEAYTRVAKHFSNFLGHDDAHAVTKADVIRYKDFRIERGIDLKTIKGTDLSAINVLFSWAVENQRIAQHPGTVKVSAPKKSKTRPQGFTNEEAVALLSAALTYEPKGKEPKHISDAKRWVPWLLAYSGARLGEMAQLRKEDVRCEDGRWIVRLNPEAGTIKTGQYRDVLVHPHLIDIGFPEFVTKSKDGHLFLKLIRKTPEGLVGALSTTKNRIGAFARSIVTDSRVQPNHGWRHRFETTSRNLGKRQDVTNAITGHGPTNVAGEYGDDEMAAQEAFFSDWPWFKVG